MDGNVINVFPSKSRYSQFVCLYEETELLAVCGSHIHARCSLFLHYLIKSENLCVRMSPHLGGLLPVFTEEHGIFSLPFFVVSCLILYWPLWIVMYLAACMLPSYSLSSGFIVTILELPKHLGD